MEIRHKSVGDLSKTEYRACYSANYGEHGYMREALVLCRASNTGNVIMLWDGPDDATRSLIGWALLTPVRTQGLLSATQYTKTRAKYTVQFWVKRQYRRRGHSKTLMAEVKKLDPRPHVFPHDKASGEFFSSYDVTIMAVDSIFMNRRKPKIA